MNKKFLLLLVVALCSCSRKQTPSNEEPKIDPVKENVISLFSDSSRIITKIMGKSRMFRLMNTVKLSIKLILKKRKNMK